MNKYVKELARIVGTENVLFGDQLADRPAGYCKTSQEAAQLVRPKSVSEISEIAKFAYANRLSLVPQGGLTGLVDGTSSTKENLIVSFERMNNVLRVDPVQNILVAQAGTRLQDAHDAANAHALMLGVDIPSRGSCTIGGMVSTNAGGIRVVRYGMTRENILGLTVVLADGTVIDAANTLMKNNAGFDLKQMFIGSEGTLGLVAEAVFKLYPKPLAESTALVAANSTENLMKLLALCHRRLGAQLVSFEAMWRDYYDKVVQGPNFGDAPLDSGYPVYGIVESAQLNQTIQGSDLESLLGIALEQELIVDAVIAQSEKERQNIWIIREVSDHTQDGHAELHSYDVGLELDDIDVFVKTLQSEMKRRWPEKPVYVFGHLGDGNLHIVLPISEKETRNRSRFDDVVYEMVGRFANSTISAEHGIGTLKKPYLELSRSSEQLDLMRRVKTALDPTGVLNPGKII